MWGFKVLLLFVVLFSYLVFEFDYYKKKNLTGVQFFDSKDSLVKEKIESELLFRFIYATWIGDKLRLLTRLKIVSQMYGYLQNSFLTKWKIKPFIKRHGINIDEIKKSLEDFKSFNDFFIRKLKDGVRPIDQSDGSIISPCDGKLFVIKNLSEKDNFFVKNQKFNLDQFLKNKKLSRDYEKGTMFVFRLAPSDYHRFHIPFDCSLSKPIRISGNYESVNPLVYKLGLNPLIGNERQFVHLKTKMFSDVCFVAVGAMMVGRIIFNYEPEEPLKKGAEFGLFEFGGSTVVLIFKEGMVQISDRFVKNSQKGYETQVKVGQIVGTKF